jgi:hypothetical protein
LIVELVSSAMPGTPVATAVHTVHRRAIGVRAHAVSCTSRPSRQRLRCRSIGAWHSRPAVRRALPGALREQEISS